MHQGKKNPVLVELLWTGNFVNMFNFSLTFSTGAFWEHRQMATGGTRGKEEGQATTGMLRLVKNPNRTLHLAFLCVFSLSNMQSAFINLCERMGHSKFLLSYIFQWKDLRSTATRPPSGRPHKATEWQRHIVCKSHQFSADSVAAVFQTSSGNNIRTKTGRQKVMAEQLLYV